MFHKHLLFDNWIGKNLKMYRYVAILEIVEWKAKIVNKSIKETQLETSLYCGRAMQGPDHGFKIYQWNKWQ